MAYTLEPGWTEKNAALDQLQSGSGDQDRKNRLSGKTAQNGVGNGVFKNIDVYYTTDPGADPASDTGWKKAGSFENITYSPSTGTGTNRAATFEFDPVEALKVKIVVRESYSSGSGQEPENQYANALEITTYAVNDVPEDKLEIGVTIDDQSYTGKYHYRSNDSGRKGV